MSNLNYLIPGLRLSLWDVDSTAYRYTDAWLDASLITAVKSLQRWWRDRYLVDNVTGDTYRNPDIIFVQAEPNVIENSDEMPLVLMATIIVKSGVLENNSWNVSTWRDAEYYVSNTEGGRAKEFSVKQDWDRLLMYLKPPQKRLNAGARESFNFGADETT